MYVFICRGWRQQLKINVGFGIIDTVNQMRLMFSVSKQSEST